MVLELAITVAATATAAGRIRISDRATTSTTPYAVVSTSATSGSEARIQPMNALQHKHWIEDLSPFPYELSHPIAVQIEFSGDDYTAWFDEGHVGASGDTLEEALSNFKDMLVSDLRVLDGQRKVLSPFLKRKLATLESLVQPGV